MTFYKSCLGGELTLTKVGETSMKSTFRPSTTGSSMPG